MDQKTKRKLFISGPITDTPFYWRQFEEARDFYETEGYAVMNPAELPVGMSNADYARICLSMIDSADEVAFLPGWHESVGAKLEHDYCYYIRKPVKLYKDDLGKHFADSIDEEQTFYCHFRRPAGCMCYRTINGEPGGVDETKACVFCKTCKPGKEKTEEANSTGSERKKLSDFAKLFCEEVAKQCDVPLALLIDHKEQEKIDGAVSRKDPLLIWRSETDKNDAFYATLLYAVEQALKNGYNADFSGDADGWHSVSLLAPVPEPTKEVKINDYGIKAEWRNANWLPVNEKDVLVWFRDRHGYDRFGIGWYSKSTGAWEVHGCDDYCKGLPVVVLAWTVLPRRPVLGSLENSK